MNRIKQLKKAWDIAGNWRLRDTDVRLANGMKSSTAKSVIKNLKRSTEQLSRKEVGMWRDANQLAINVEEPRRGFLYPIYGDAMHDLHLKGAVRNRKMKVMRKPIVVKDIDGNIDTELTELVRTKWAKRFISLSLDAIFWGHSLIQFGDIIRDEKLRFKNVKLVPREHVIPERGIVLPEPGDDFKKGIDIEKNPWIIMVHRDEEDLGELNSCCKEAISKKNIMQFWDGFAEMFGAPLRYANTPSRNETDLDKIEDMLENMGFASWGIFPEGTEVKLMEQKQSDAFRVYDYRIIRANSEMSKGILGQTMTMDDGSSLSQAQVHEDVADDIAEDDTDFILDVLNDDLLPFLISHGFPFTNRKIGFDETIDYTVTEMKDIEEMLLGEYDVDPQYFIDKYGVAITGKKETGETPTADDKSKLSYKPGFFD